ncbi:glycosyltransferase family 4 protein [Priestia megaterium]|uniref:glycosyltransferase family 4 protein n=1 Tax=Priestia megaterium TaxID=1404 RepID=UPI003D2E594A
MHYDFLMIGWELDYSRNGVMVDREKFKIKEIKIKKENFALRYVKTLFKILNALIRYRTKIVYIPAFNQVNSPFIILVSKLFRKKLIIDILVSEYDTIVEDRKLAKPNSFKAKKAYFLDKICLKYADRLICDTELHKEYFVRKFQCDANKISVISVGAEEHFDYIENNKKNQDFGVIFYGGFSPLHGIDIILKAAAYLKNNSSIKFTLVGSGQTKNEMLKLAQELELSNVTFIDRVDYRDLPSFLSNFDVGLGIFGETDKAQRVVPNKVYQVAACKLPVITRDTPGIKEVFTHNKDSLLISSGDQQAYKLAESIQLLQNDPNLKKDIEKNGYRLMKTNYSVRNIREQFSYLVK